MGDLKRVIDVLGNYPGYLADIGEMRQIASAENSELQRMYQGCDSLWEDGFIETASYQGIKRWESLLGIRPYPGDGLEERRAAVLLRWNQQLPYTLERLKERLGAAVGDGYELDVRYNQYELDLMVVSQPYRVLWEVREMTRAMIPANLLFTFAGKFPGKFLVDVGAWSGLELGSGFYARYNREFLYLDGGWVLDGSYALNGYKELIGLDLYPAGLEVLSGVLVRERAGLGKIGALCGVFQSVDVGLDLCFGLDMDVNPGICMKGLVSGEAAACWDVGTGMHFYGDGTYGNGGVGLLAEGDVDVLGDVPVEMDVQGGLLVHGGISAAPGGVGRLTVEKDFWYLDGSFLLDGTKLLDAEIFVYE